MKREEGVAEIEEWRIISVTWAILGDIFFLRRVELQNIKLIFAPVKTCERASPRTALKALTTTAWVAEANE